MKKILFFVLLLMAARTNAQQFVNGFQLALPDSISDPSVDWVDLDNDGLLDVLVMANVNSNVYLIAFKSDTVQGFLYETSTNTQFQSAILHLADYDLDNDIDIILSGSSSGGSQTTAWLNQNDFTFLPEPILAAKGSVIAFADLNNDGSGELVLGRDSLTIYERNGLSWKIVNDSIAIEATSVAIFDGDGDFDNDLFVSGRNLAGAAKTMAFFNDGKYTFKSIGTLPSIAGQLFVGDLDHDGNFDIVLSGKNDADRWVTRLLINRAHSFVIKDSLIQLADAHILPADFNSDGKCDLQFFGMEESGNDVNKISFFQPGEENLPLADVVRQRFGDFDKDGDLDLIQIVQGSTSFELKHFDNTNAIRNNAPARPFDAVGFQLFDRAFVYWSRPTDDHTPSGSLTYDLTIQSSMEERMIGSFDLINHKRLTVSHGNIGARNFAMVSNPGGGGLQYVVQSVDNSFHAASGGICIGGGVPLCGEVIPEVVKVCRNQNVILTADASSLWFSFRDGFISHGPSLEVAVNAGDTIFALTPMASSGCAVVKLFSVEIGSGIIETIDSVKHACENQELTFEAESSWVGVAWSSTKRGFLSNDFSMTFQVDGADTVKVLLSDGSGCLVERRTAIVISKPVLELNGEVFQILRGESVRLSASGGDSYSWSPSAGLDNPQSAQPVASPVSTTSYVVTLTDSMGCTTDGSVIVMVEGTAFIPNLFTPNNDGRNDEVKIYGLANVKNFRFTIHNREGNTVYDTDNIQQATTVGWNGAVRGSQLPSGVYYWKVKGEQPSGGKLLLNGKTTGSIVLIR